jgi:2-polyprenyl-3-methyl-5-hydroxy-6-metoxy-1,4-benzoquinol methylase
MQFEFTPVSHCVMCGSHDSKSKLKGFRMNSSQRNINKKASAISLAIKQCSGCGLIYSNPLAQIINNYKYNDRRVDNNAAAYTVEPNNHYYEEQVDKIKKHLPANAKALDVGAGYGNMMVALNKIGCYGIEPSEHAYKTAITQRKISPEKLKHVSFENYEHKGNYFDFIFLESLQHLYNPAKSLKKATDLLKPGGVLLIEVSSANWFLGKLINVFHKLRLTNLVTHLSPLHPPFNQYEFTLKAFEAQAAQLNLALLQAENYVCHTYTGGLTDKLLRWYMQKTKTGMELTVLFQKQ